MARKVYVGGTATLRKNGLPMKYKQVASLQSSGTQFVNSNFYPSGKALRVVIKFKYTASHDGLSLFGNSTNDQFSITVYGSKPVFYVGTSSAVSCGSQTSLNTSYTLDVTANNGTLTAIWNGTKYTASYSGSLRTDRPMFIFGSNNGDIAETGNGYLLEYIQFYDNGTLVRDYIPCVDPDEGGGLYDFVEGKFYGNAGTGSFSVGAEVITETYEVDNVALTVKQIYLGVQNVARRVRKGYIGIGGVARPFWGDKELVYYGTITALSQGRNPARATVGNYALLGGGKDYSNVDVYDTSLVKSTATALSAGKHALAGASTENHALFGGGYNSSSSAQKTVDAYDASLTKSTPTGFSRTGANNAGASIGGYALFAMAIDGTMNAYNKSLTRSIPTAQSGATDFQYLEAASNGIHALFAGGGKGGSTCVNAYDASLTKYNPSDLSENRCDVAVASVVGFILVAGGSVNGLGSTHTAIVDAYDTNLTKVNAPSLSVSRTYIAGATVDEYAIFAGGYAGSGGSSSSDVADYYDKNLTRNVTTPLSSKRQGATGVTVGKYALICGGSSGNYINSVDAYTVI